MSESRPPSNVAKFQTRNPVVQRLIDRFFANVAAIVEPLNATSVLDAGCGEGETIARLGGLLPESVHAVDVEQRCVDHVRARLPAVGVSRQSVTGTSFDDGQFDLALCLEVLEHLVDPSAAVRELGRVADGHVVISVPHEPWFQLGSLVRGKHLKALGNHPEHLNRFNRRSLGALLRADLEVDRIEVSFPWLIAVGRPR